MEIGVDGPQKSRTRSTILDPAILLLRIFTKKSTSYYGDTYAFMFIAALFAIAKKWEQPRSPSTKEGMIKVWYI